MEFGKSLRIAREAKGYTVSQLAETTRLPPSIIENLENDDFSRIPAPIYGRGFVKLYCEGVGLEPKPFVDEFMEIVNGNRDPGIRERPVSPAMPAPTPAVEPEPAPEASPEPEPVLEKPQQDLFSEPQPTAEPSAGPTLSRYATPYREDELAKASFTSSLLSARLAVLAIGALVVLFLLAWGIRALYRATMPAAAESETVAPAAAATPAATETKSAAAPRTPQEIPALYLD